MLCIRDLYWPEVEAQARSRPAAVVQTLPGPGRVIFFPINAQGMGRFSTA